MSRELFFAISCMLFLVLIFSSVSHAMEVDYYYGKGCPHCARLDARMQDLSDDYDLTIEKKEIYYDADNRQEMFDLYVRFGLDPGDSGVPTALLDNRSLIIGELSSERLESVLIEHENNISAKGIITEDSFSPIEERDPTSNLTLVVLLGAALADSVNPCTIAVMTMLLGVILTTDGKKKVFAAALTFIGVIFISYLLMGLGILHTITSTELTNIFFSIVTVLALILAILEIKAYFDYSPGLLSVEIPMFLRPYMKDVISKATSIPGVAFAALVCSIFLLPCSSGPYLMVLGMLAQSVTLQGIFYLFIYNFVFVLPMLIIAVAIGLGKTNVDELGEFREQHIRKLHLFAGVLFFLLFLLLVNQMFGFFEL
jgi:cytochrome c biogenesis protein CcdA/glutaredoxin